MSVFAVPVDCTFFERACYLVYLRAKKFRNIPFDKLCQAISDLAGQHAEDNETDFRACLPEQAAFGGQYYPHEEFLRTNDLTHISFWKTLQRRYGHGVFTQQEKAFASALWQQIAA